MSDKVGQTSKRILTVMEVKLVLAPRDIASVENKYRSTALRNAFSSAELVIKENSGTIIRSSNAGILSVFGDKKSQNNSAISACFSAWKIFEENIYININNLDDFEVQGREFIGAHRNKARISIGISTGELDVTYERDIRYPIKSAKGLAFNHAHSLRMYSEQIGSPVVDDETYSIIEQTNSKIQMYRKGLSFSSATDEGFHKTRFPDTKFYLIVPKKHDHENGASSNRDLPPESAVPEQASLGLNFGGEDKEPIRVIDFAVGGLRDSEDQRQSYIEIREKALEINESCGQRNQLSKLQSTSAKLISAMGNSLLEIRVRIFWSQMNSLRRQLEADERSRTLNDPDDLPLPEKLAAALGDLVDTLNVFAAHEPKLVELDELKRDPAERLANNLTHDAALQVTAGALASPQTVAPDAANDLFELSKEANGASWSADRANEFFIRSVRNLALEAIRRSYKLVTNEAVIISKGVREGAYRAIGSAGGVYGAAILIAKYEAQIRLVIDTMGRNHTLHKIIDLIVNMVK